MPALSTTRPLSLVCLLTNELLNRCPYEKRMTASKRRGIWSRRDFLTRMGWAGFGFVSLAALLGFIRSAFPRVLFQPPSILKVGLPSDYALGEVSEKYKQDYRVWIVREDEGIYALFA